MTALRPLRIREAAMILGVHERTLKRWIDAGQGPVVTVEGTTYGIWREDLDAWIATRTGERKADVA